MQRASEYTVEVHDRPMLRIQLHEEDSGTRLGDNTHPWHALFEQPNTLQAQVQALDNNNLAQRTVSSTVGFAATGRTTEPFCYVDATQSGLRANTHSACPTIYADEINTQGLLDGLEDLYDFGDEDARPNEPSNATTKDSNENTNAGDGNSCLDHLDNLDPDEADAIISQLGAFEDVKASLEYTTDAPVKEYKGVLSHRLSADAGNRQAASEVLDTLVDMSDGEAERIVGSLGGFSKPPQTPFKCGSQFTKGSDNASSRSEQIERKSPDANTQMREIPEMEDTEARSIIQSLGGFARVSNQSGNGTALKPLSAKSAVAAVAPQPASTYQACTPPPGAPTASMPCQRQGSAGQTTPSQFPSKRDVLSARRALKMDSGKAQVPVFSPPSRMGAGRSMTLAPEGIGRDIAQVSGSKRQLAFKIPGIKRPAAKLRFNSPTKRLALDGGQTGDGQEVANAGAGDHSGGNSNGGCKPAGQLLQFSQPFRSPAKANPDSPRNREAIQRPLNRSRVPPVLPPVTPKRQKASSQTNPNIAHLQAHRPENAPALPLPRQRHNLKSIAGLVSSKCSQEVPQDAVAMTSEMAASYRFLSKNFVQGWGAEEARQVLITRGCAPDTATRAWVQNHFRWTVWTGACFARRIPSRWREFWSIEYITERLLYRYRREIEGGERSALRRIIEADSAPQQIMVLCVASVEYKGLATHIEVTDGWYSVGAQVDVILVQAIHNGRLRVGDKIVCAGTGMGGLSEGVEPLSAGSEAVFLVLNANCVRRARWDTTLGFQRGKTMSMSLSAVHSKGGAVGAALDVVVMRRYPMVFMETTAGGRRIIRSEKEEERLQLRFEEDRAGRMQELLEQRRTLHITSQGGALEEYTEEMNDEDEVAVMGAIDREMPRRQVHGLFRMLVCDYPAHEYKHSKPSTGRLAMVTIWRPRNIVPDDIPEGSRLRITGAVVSPYRASVHAAAPSLHLNFSTSSGRLRPMAVNPDMIAQTEYRERGALYVDELQHVRSKQEVDITGSVDSHCAGIDGRRSVLRLCSTDDHGVEHYASVEFSGDVFGCICPRAGSTVTVRNCQYTLELDSAAHEFRLRAEDTAEFVL
ncbi:hypothetical protein H4R24_004088 [Coemansia sp. RSA 988]|nr:hypothetical protein H4R24_004088 [Coemansia sp. RSA 988]